MVGAAGAAVERVQVLDQLGAGLPEREGPGVGVAVGVAGVGQDVAERDAVWAGIAVSTGTRARAGSWRQEQTVIRRASSGTGGPCSSRIMVAAEG